MGFVGLVQFSLQCFDVLAWPLLSLVYPLCCTIRAIEANSVSDSQKMNTYWVVFSLILQFEHAFMKLLKWLPLWPFFRLIIVFWLVIPHFGGAFYVYKHLICPCLSTDLQIVVNWFNKRKKSSFNTDNVFTEVERYAHEKGPEALEKVVASKSERTKSNPDAKEFKAVSSLENKEVIQAKHNLTGTGNSKFAAMEIKEKAIEVVADRNIMNTPPLNEVQKGWTFNSDLDSRNLKNAIEGPKARNQAEPRLTQIGNGALAAVEASVNPVEIATGRELIESSQNVPKEWTCALEVTIPSERTLNSNLIRIHKASHEALNAKRQAYVPKMALAKSDKHEEPGKSIPSVASKPKVIINQEVQAEELENRIPSSGSKPMWIINPKVQAEEPENSIPSSGVKPKIIINRKVQAGEPEQSIPEALEKVVASKSERTKSNPDAKEFKAVSSLENKEVIQAKHNLTGTGNSKFAAMEIKEKAIEVVADRNIMKTPPLNEVQKGWTFNSDLDSKNLKNAIEGPKARNQAEPRLTQIGNGVLAAVEASVNPVAIATGRELIESSQNVPKEWTCALEVTIPSERTLNSNLIRIHKASHEALNAKRQVYVPKMALAKSDKHEEPGKSIPSVASKPKVSQAEPDLTGTENSRFPSMDIKEKAIGIASERGILNIPPSEKVREWTSAVSQVTTQSDTTFNSYSDGKIHEAEAKHTQMENGTFATMETQEKVVEVVTSIESALQVQKEWTCALCQVTTQSEATLNSHLQGRKHKAACEALKAKSWPFAPKIAPGSAAKESNQPNKEQGKTTTSSASKQKVIVDEKVQSQKNSIPTSRTKTSDKSKKEPAEGASINGSQQGNPIEVPSMKDLTLSCSVCNVHCPSEIVMASHLNGRKHQKKMQQRQQNPN
ncbi:uncharacterized protein LOC110759105 [Prunus avium]|uniref:Uncharacterized protein LOC110759105 n=1 Tax=Prunus avium TaxID=42229 RepID=A0A6P5ST30_PRUAV|nr:uncharacterized protein LOC110759105 [Prunus avium]